MSLIESLELEEMHSAETISGNDDPAAARHDARSYNAVNGARDELFFILPIPYTQSVVLGARNYVVTVGCDCQGSDLGDVALERPFGFPARQIPHTQRVIPRTRDHVSTIGCDRHRGYRISMALEHPFGFSGHQIPHSQSIVPRTRDDVTTIERD